MTHKNKQYKVLAKLALLDLQHEWILTLCMVLAIAAVLAPLLILLGLKQGVIHTMRDRLVEDPVNREIKPAITLELSQQWFDDIAQRSDVEFVIPTILRGSSIVRLEAPDTHKRLIIDLVPTAAHDPLILENEGIIPKEGECVLSFAAAEKLGVTTGHILTAKVTRTRNKRREYVETDLRIVAILNPRADALERIYTPFEFVNDVETYREGHAVPKRQWSGAPVAPHLSYDGLWVLMPHSLSSIEETTLMIGTGLADIRTLSPDEFRRSLGFPLPTGYNVYELTTQGSTISTNSIKKVKNKVRGKSAIILPFAQNIEISMNGERLKIVGLSLSSEQSDRLGLPPLPWGKFETSVQQGQILWPRKFTDKHNVILKYSDIQFPVKGRGMSFGDYAIVPSELIGILRTGQSRKIIFDTLQQTFLLAKIEYHGFRLYARSIEDVLTLHREFIEQDIDVITQAQEIEKVQVLDRGLTQIFWLIAIVGIMGGMAALIASLYASVERKKRDISVLRLMGFSRFAVFQFPIYQSVIIALLSVCLAIAMYTVFSSTINFVFEKDLTIEQQICTLSSLHFILTFVFTILIAALSALVAAKKTTQIDPAEGIREE